MWMGKSLGVNSIRFSAGNIMLAIARASESLGVQDDPRKVTSEASGMRSHV